MNRIAAYQKKQWAIAIRLLTALLTLYCYYQGLHKLLSFANYHFWLEHVPFIKKVPQVFAYGVPAFYLAVALLLMIGKTKTIALWTLIVAEILFVGWVLYVRSYTPYLFWPWHMLWDGELKWFYKFLEAISVAWLGAVLLYRQYRNNKKQIYI